MKSINREALFLSWTHNKLKQVRSKEEKEKFIGVEEQEVVGVILSLGFSIFVWHYTKWQIYTEEVVKFFPREDFPRIKALCLFCVVLVYLLVILVHYIIDLIYLN